MSADAIGKDQIDGHTYTLKDHGCPFSIILAGCVRLIERHIINSTFVIMGVAHGEGTRATGLSIRYSWR